MYEGKYCPTAFSDDGTGTIEVSDGATKGKNLNGETVGDCFMAHGQACAHPLRVSSVEQCMLRCDTKVGCKSFQMKAWRIYHRDCNFEQYNYTYGLDSPHSGYGDENDYSNVAAPPKWMQQCTQQYDQSSDVWECRLFSQRPDMQQPGELTCKNCLHNDHKLAHETYWAGGSEDGSWPFSREHADYLR
jgi:hypothetical protein